MQISIYRQETKYRIRDTGKLKLFLKSLFKKESTDLQSVDLILCSDEFLLGINRQFLKHDFYTDIITFNLALSNAPVIGELYISIDRVRENAGIQGTGINYELHRVIFHGCLHLCGYKDKLKKDIKIMREKENIYLKRYFSIT